MKKIKILQNVPVSRDGMHVEDWKKGQVEEVDESLFNALVKGKLAVEYILEPEPEPNNTINEDKEQVEEKPKKQRGRPKKVKKSPSNKALKSAPENK